MQTLFTPWRYSWLTSPKGERSCIFCEASTTSNAERSLLLLRTSRILVMLNRYPYANGHLMVAPRDHAANLFESEPDILTELIRIAAASQRILAGTYRPDGFNVGMNFGQAAGAGFADHYHMHVVPRWEGDSNFMSVTADTRLVPETLEASFAKLQPKFTDLQREFLKADEA